VALAAARHPALLAFVGAGQSVRLVQKQFELWGHCPCTLMWAWVCKLWTSITGFTSC